MVKCKDCGSENTFQETGSVVRCSDCFARITIEEPVPYQKSSEEISGPIGLISVLLKNLLKEINNSEQKNLLKVIFTISFAFMILSFSVILFTPDGTNYSSSSNAPNVEPVSLEETLKEVEKSKIENSIPSSEFSVEDLTEIPDSIGNIYWIGYIKNNSTEIAEKPKLNITVFDKKNKELATSFGYGEKDYLKPGEKTIINVLLRNSPKFDHIEAKVETVKAYYERKETVFAIEDYSVKQTNNNSINVKGKVKNLSKIRVHYVHLSILGRNSKNKILGVSTHFLQDKELDPNESAEFDFNLFQIYENPAKVEFEIDALEKK